MAEFDCVLSGKKMTIRLISLFFKALLSIEQIRNILKITASLFLFVFCDVILSTVKSSRLPEGGRFLVDYLLPVIKHNVIC